MRSKILVMQIKTRQILLLLFFLAFCIKVYCLDKNPLQYDGTLYAEMIAEEAKSLTFLPTYLGAWAPWKPGVFFIVYSLFLPITSNLFTSIDLIYKSPNLLFGLLNAVIFYYIVKRFSKENVALVAALLFYSCYGAFYVESRLLMETFMLTMLLASLFFYTHRKMEPKTRFFGAGLFALLACLTKTVISFMLIPVSVAYFFQHERKNLSNPLFLLSLLAPFLGMFLFYLSLDNVGLVEEVLVEDTGKFFFILDYFPKISKNAFTALIYFIVMFPLYLLIAARIAVNSWKKYLFFSAWFLISLIPALSGEPHHWYFYYVAPAVAFFAAIALPEKGKLDTFSLFLVAILFFSNVGYLALGGLLTSSCELEGREIGISIAGKEKVLIIGSYAPSTTILSYKILSERRDSGSYLDVGYVVLIGDYADSTEGNLSVPLNTIVADYNTNEYRFESGNFAAMFQTDKFLRKKTNLTKFEYVVVSPSSFTLQLPEYELIDNRSCISVYKHSGEPKAN